MVQRKGVAIFTLALLLALPALAQQDDDSEAAGVLYRYQDANGQQVIVQSIPPEMAPKGYDIISKSGQLLKTVPPAPKGADIQKMMEQMRIEAELAEWDSRLRRRYSSVKDIRSAKERSLSELKGNLSILRSNLSGVKSQIEDQQARAAVQERSGRAVSEPVLQNIQTLEAELVGILQQIEMRTQELEAEAARFDRDIERFAEISQQRPQ